MNAVDCVKNAVFTLWMEETREPTDADTPATAATAGLLQTGGGVVNPAEVH